jgi:hypothetical protein
MGVRNTEELGVNLQKIMNRLLANDNLVNLLYYSTKDPLNSPPLTNEQKQNEVYEKLIKIVPRVGPREDAKSVIVIRVVSAHKIPGNTDFKAIKIAIEVFVPLTQWFIKDSNLRPFAILGEIENSLEGKVINGLGKMTGGDFDINFLTEEMSAYEQTFFITQYE